MTQVYDHVLYLSAMDLEKLGLDMSSDDVVSSAASRLAVSFFVFPLVATVPSPDVKYVT